MSKEEVKKWVAIGLVDKGAIAVTAAMTAFEDQLPQQQYISGQKFLKNNDGLFRIVNAENRCFHWVLRSDYISCKRYQKDMT